MSKPIKLDAGQKNILRLLHRDRNSEGWARVSKMLYPHLSANIPVELAIFERDEAGGAGRAKLTQQGENIVFAMEWL